MAGSALAQLVVDRVREWLQTAREYYGVNPWIFFALAVASGPPFYFALFRLVRALARGNTAGAAAWAGVGLFDFVTPWIYVLLFGRNLPWWVYVLFGLTVAWGGWTLVTNARKKRPRQERPGGTD